MKKLFFLTISCLMTMSFTNKPVSIHNELVPWWAVALADGAGAMSGAGSVVSLCPTCLATPIGQGAVVLGGVVSGVASSLAIQGMVEPTNPNGGVLPQNPLNDLDYIGSKHNQLVNDFIRDNEELTAANFFSYISENKEKYGEGELYLTEEFFSEQINEISSLNEISEILDYIADKLPQNVNKEEFKTELSKIASSSNREEFISKTKSFENQFFEENSLEKGDEIAMKGFFSTLRFSASMW
jgi:hypothetical protein